MTAAPVVEADLGVTGIAELATPTGRSARTGSDQGRLRVVRDAALACRDGVVVFVGEECEYRARVRVLPGGREVDAGGRTVLPGFVDAHTHLPFAGWREGEFAQRLAGVTYAEIAAQGGGILSTVKATRGASLEQLVVLVRERLDVLAALGTTTVEAKSGYGLEYDAEIRQLEALRLAADGHPVEVVPTFLGAHTVPHERRSDRDGYVRDVVERMLPEVARRGLAEYADAFVDAHAFSVGEARRVLRAARELGLAVRVHADQLADDGGAALAAELGAVSADHLEHASDAGLEALARAGTCGVLLPGAAVFLMARVRPPGRRLIAAGVPAVVASDFNPGTCPCESMAVAVQFACLSAGLTIDEAITAATLNAAASLGRANVTGSLEPGKRADFVIHDLPNRYHLVYRFGMPRVWKVFARGRETGTA